MNFKRAAYKIAETWTHMYGVDDIGQEKLKSLFVFGYLGLSYEELNESLDISNRKYEKSNWDEEDQWKYFCGVCWSKIKDMDDISVTDQAEAYGAIESLIKGELEIDLEKLKKEIIEEETEKIKNKIRQELYENFREKIIEEEIDSIQELVLDDLRYMIRQEMESEIRSEIIKEGNPLPNVVEVQE